MINRGSWMTFQLYLRSNSLPGANDRHHHHHRGTGTETSIADAIETTGT
jgi:hypothetical protein